MPDIYKSTNIVVALRDLKGMESQKKNCALSHQFYTIEKRYIKMT